MHVLCNTEARLCNHRGCGNVIIITYNECVFVALDIQHEMRIAPTVICDLSGSTVFFYIIS